MPYPVYKLLHFLGIFMVLTVLAAASMHVLRGGARMDNPYRKAMGAAHGVGAFLILLGGFGMLARLGIAHGGLPQWIYFKLAIWVVLSGAVAVVYRGPGLARTVLFAVPLLAVLAGAIALYKPF
jgi:hypothetical protein